MNPDATDYTSRRHGRDYSEGRCGPVRREERVLRADPRRKCHENRELQGLQAENMGRVTSGPVGVDPEVIEIA